MDSVKIRPSRLERRIDASVTTGMCAAVSVSAAFGFAVCGLMPLALFTGLVASVLSIVNVVVLYLIEYDIEVIRTKSRVLVQLPLDD